MSLMINEVTQLAALSSLHGGLTSGQGIILVTLLLLLLVERVLVDALGRWRPSVWVRIFNFAILPLAFVLVVFAAVRLAELVHIL